MNGWGKGNVSFSPFISFFVFLSEVEQCGTTTFFISCLKDRIQNVLTVYSFHTAADVGCNTQGQHNIRK